MERALIFMAIKLQKQPTNWSCVHTCLAMLLDEPVEEVIKAIDIDRGLTQKEIIVQLEKFRICFNCYVFADLLHTGYYLMTVPSLNNVGGQHEILVHYNFHKNKFRVYDPSPKKTYDRKGNNLTNWTDLIEVIPGGKLP